MAYTYDGNPFQGTTPYPDAVARDTVRFLLGDTDDSDWQLQDGEIAGLLNNNVDDVYQAAIEGCRVLTAKYSRQVNKSIGNASVEAEMRAKHYRDLVHDLTKQSLRHGGALQIVGTGLSNDTHESDAEDDDLVQPNFTVGMHDDPGGDAVDVNNGTGFTQVVPG